MNETPLEYKEAKNINSDSPFRSYSQIVQSYQKWIKDNKSRRINLNKWLDLDIQLLMPGDMVTIIGSTGVGKTFMAQQLCNITQLPVLFVELELSEQLLAKRFLAIRNETSTTNIDIMTINQQEYNIDGFHHVTFIQRPQITADIIRNEIKNMKEEVGFHPELVVIDYFQLMGYGAKNRYEAMSHAAEDLRVIARTNDTIIVSLSQVSREASRKDEGLELFDAKESGSIENSSSVVISISKKKSYKSSGKDYTKTKYDSIHDEFDKNTLVVKVLKNTNGPAGFEKEISIDWETMSIVS